MPRRGEPPPDSAHLCGANSDEGKGQGGYLRLLGSALITVDCKQIVLPWDETEGDLCVLANNGSFNMLKESEARTDGNKHGINQRECVLFPQWRGSVHLLFEFRSCST